MANTTIRGALSIHGTNPQYLIEKVIRARIYDSLYWKEHCFALDAATVIDEALKLQYLGGTYANTRPTEFMCLTLKLLQLQPEREIILEYLRAEEFKYLRALAAFYVRLTFDPVNVYEVLEPLFDDYRKLRTRGMDGAYSITTIDEFCDQLLSEERVCEIQLPRLTQRRVLEETEGLAPRKSKLGRALGVVSSEEAQRREGDEGSDEEVEGEEGRYLSRSPSMSMSPEVEEAEPEYWTEGSEEEEEGEEGKTGRFVSKSPSAESEDEGRYISRSPTPEGERIEGDV
ncbi:BZ3500_MvSof-1268-A1-R1_Chr6-3g08716 [Microbotryum saponariae]|uniref:Pre-mRNA-splicing factor 38 n=1 Tax=Microbotryum saponariae TaxID=289078 RepID=A0A2X0MNT2_9BASI|nr:BZ3500_MvSof-1268-A1-R1_Chr6-3g08716 [Microbotryum saponariae]SDA07317.1 BZ3501_MvSof-1269-A2-R1_Chr6-2g08419 [Microbotryum saponariae]